MGIKDLFLLLRRYAGGVKEAYPIAQYKGKCFGIDASAIIYTFLYFAGEDLTHLMSQFQGFTSFLIENEITPVFVFDGQHATFAKAATLADRAKRRALAQERIATLSTEMEQLDEQIARMEETTLPPAQNPEVSQDPKAEISEEPKPAKTEEPRPEGAEEPKPAKPEGPKQEGAEEPKPAKPEGPKQEGAEEPLPAESDPPKATEPQITLPQLLGQKHLVEATLSKLKVQTYKVKATHTAPILEWLKSEGLPYIIANYEADFVLNKLAKTRIIDYIVADDGDMLVDLPEHVSLLRQVNKHRFGKCEIDEYNKGKILQELNLSQDDFRELCILLGCDYCSRIPGCGLVHSLRMIRSHHKIETILEKETKLKRKVSDDYLADVATAREHFINPPGEDDLGLVTEMISEFQTKMCK